VAEDCLPRITSGACNGMLLPFWILYPDTLLSG
jgi:hypothetical protein